MCLSDKPWVGCGLIAASGIFGRLDDRSYIPLNSANGEVDGWRREFPASVEA